jgi:hypothetical protein
MKLLSMTAMAAALALLPVAHAQVSCFEVEELLDLAWDDFLDITGESANDEVYETDYWLADANECFVSIDFAAMYVCFWTLAGEADAEAAFTTISQSMEACLTDWDRHRDVSLAPEAGMTAVRSLVLGGTGEFVDMEWLLSLDRHQTDQMTDWHVSLALTYF